MCKSYSPKLGRCWNSYNDIAEQTGMKRETVIQTVNELVKGHFITRQRRRSNDNRRVFVDNLYRIVRYVTGKITKKIKRLYRTYNRRTGLLDSKAIAQFDYNRNARFCQVVNWNEFQVRGSPQNAALF
jgi:DNA-binding Lrp family transcriptional regulator